MERINDIIKTIYEGNNLPTLDRLYKLVKRGHPHLTKKDCKNFLDKQLEQQLTRQKNRNPEEMGYITALTPRMLYQIDICVMEKYAYGYHHHDKKQEEKRIIKLHRNNGYKYIFIMICVFSRKVYVVPMKDKSIESTTAALAKDYYNNL
jgi:hypothetical protein